MKARDILMVLASGNMIAKCIIMLFILLFPSIGFAQPVPFTPDSIPMRDNEIVFEANFNFDLTKQEFHKRTFRYLNSELDPYSGTFLITNNDSTVCNITDYLVMDGNFAYVFAMYMTYDLKLNYRDGSCLLSISNITFMEKGYYEAQENSERELDMPEYSAKDIMINKEYSTLTIRRASDKITEEAIKRINEIVKNFDLSFVR